MICGTRKEKDDRQIELCDEGSLVMLIKREGWKSLTQGGKTYVDWWEWEKNTGRMDNQKLEN